MTEVDGTKLLDPGLAPFAELIPRLELDARTLPDIRAGFLSMIKDLAQLGDLVERTDHVVSDSPDPDNPVVVRVHRPRNAVGPDAANRPLPAIVWFHGGGYVMGGVDMDDSTFDRWCPMLEVIGVSVEYRLAPETPYPGPLEDCYAALLWTHDHAAELGIDPERVGIGGLSAGGGLAAALAILARNRGELPVSFQLLECPMVDDRMVTPSSRLDGLAVWSRESNEFGWRSYLGDLYGTDEVSGTAAPAREADLRGLPPAYVAVGGADGFRDEDVEYALRLQRAGVPTELHVYPGYPHWVTLFLGTSQAQRWWRDVDDWLARRLHPGC